MNAQVASTYIGFDIHSSPSVSSPKLVMQKFVPAPSLEIRLERAAGRGLDVLMQIKDRAGEPPLDSEITPGVLGQLFAALPPELPIVEPYVSEQGSLCFDWDDNPRNALSILLQGNRKIGYSAYFDGERVRGSVEFDSGLLPRDLLGLVYRWVLRGQGRP